jgi:membrane protease YdiL (CAAX protease family)
VTDDARVTPALLRPTLAAGAVALLTSVAYLSRRTSALHVTDPLAVVPGLLVMAALLFGYLSLASRRVRAAARAFVATGSHRFARAIAWPLFLLAGVLAYVALIGLPLGVRVLAYGAYLTAPVLALAAGPRPDFTSGHRTRGVRNVLAVTLLLVPAALRLLPSLPVPAAGGPDIVKYAGYAVAAWCFLVVAPLPRVGYGQRLDGRSLRVALAGFLAFSLFAVPVGLATHFLAWSPRVDAGRLALLPALLTLTTAVPEELIFRGVIQRLAEGPTGTRRWRGLAVASVLFGLAHAPDPRYVLLATVAGVVYGLVYQRTGVILAPVVTHVLVDWTWAVLLRG